LYEAEVSVYQQTELWEILRSRVQPHFHRSE
jgi:hypothetical protein